MRKMFTTCVLSVEGFLPFLDGIQVISSKILLPQGNRSHFAFPYVLYVFLLCYQLNALTNENYKMMDFEEMSATRMAKKRNYPVKRGLQLL